MLFAKFAINKKLNLKESIPPSDGECDWCGGECRIIQLDYYRFYFEDGRMMYRGWYSPECAWLASCAADCVNNDDS